MPIGTVPVKPRNSKSLRGKEPEPETWPDKGRDDNPIVACATRTALGNRQPESGNRLLYPCRKRPCATPPQGGVGQVPFLHPLAGVPERHSGSTLLFYETSPLQLALTRFQFVPKGLSDNAWSGCLGFY